MFFDGKDHSGDAGYNAFLNDKEFQDAAAAGMAGQNFSFDVEKAPDPTVYGQPING